VVVLRGLDIHGAGTGINGVLSSGGGALIIEDCRIQSFTGDGVKIASNISQKVVIRRSEIRANQRGVEVIPISPAIAKVIVEESEISDNSASGIDVAGTNNAASAYNTTLTHNGVGFQVQLVTSNGYLENA